MAGEHVILLDEQDQPAGMLEKYAAHTFDTPLHLAFSCWLFNQQGQLLVTRRSLGKKAWPGVWTNSVCGHPQQGVPQRFQCHIWSLPDVCFFHFMRGGTGCQWVVPPGGQMKRAPQA